MHRVVVLFVLFQIEAAISIEQKQVYSNCFVRVLYREL